MGIEPAWMTHYCFRRDLSIVENSGDRHVVHPAHIPWPGHSDLKKRRTDLEVDMAFKPCPALFASMFPGMHEVDLSWGQRGYQWTVEAVWALFKCNVRVWSLRQGRHWETETLLTEMWKQRSIQFAEHQCESVMGSFGKNLSQDWQIGV